MFHAPVVFTLMVSAGVQGIIHWIWGVRWRRLQRKVVSFFPFILPHGWYSALVFLQLILCEEIDNMTEIKEK